MFVRDKSEGRPSPPDGGTFTWPSLRSPVGALFIVGSLVLTLFVLVPELWDGGKTKDYPMWFWVGQQVLHGGDIYAGGASGVFRYLYPPLSAILLAIPAFFGKIPLYLMLCALNAAAWWITIELCNAMTGADRPIPRWLAVLPSLAMLSSIFDSFDLGQPNLLLLMLMLSGFWLLQRGRLKTAGSLFALATAIKAFPLAVFPYLLWRRHWKTAASMAVCLGILLFLVPAPVRGFQRNISDLETWFHGMVGSSSEKGFGQRDEQNWSWENQSLIAVTHRLARRVNYNQLTPGRPAGYVNLLDLDFETANLVLLVVSLLIGLGFVTAMPPRLQVTRASNAAELGILFCLMTICSPLARQYYFVWLFFPVTVLMHRAAFDRRSGVRTATWSLLAAAGGLMILSLPAFPKFFQAAGNNFAATFVIVVGLAWHMRNPPAAIAAVEHSGSAGLWDDERNATTTA